MTGTEKLKKHENHVGYLKMAIALNLGEGRDDVDDALHPRETSTGVIISLMTAPEDFSNEH
jgi:hypothetical protein